jgi:hypothetical protein
MPTSKPAVKRLTMPHINTPAITPDMATPDTQGNRSLDWPRHLFKYYTDLSIRMVFLQVSLAHQVFRIQFYQPIKTATIFILWIFSVLRIQFYQPMKTTSNLSLDDFFSLINWHCLWKINKKLVHSCFLKALFITDETLTQQ